MKRTTLEVDYRDIWPEIFRPNADKVEVLEGVRSIKCDLDGFAIICRIRLKDRRMKVQDLIRGGPLNAVETLYEDEDGSQVVFVEGKLGAGRPRRDAPDMKIVAAGPPEFLDKDTMRITFVGSETDTRKLLQYLADVKVGHRILALGSLGLGSGSVLSRLTEKQRRSLLTAFSLGYYDVPRKVSSETVARHLKLDKSTLMEHLRKAERNLLGAVLPGR